MRQDAGQTVYFARCIGPSGAPLGAYKIGCSHGHGTRIKAVTVNLPFTLELIATTQGGLVTEAACLLHLREYRIRGEYVAENDATTFFMRRVVATGSAFHFLNDLGDFVEGDEWLEPFLAYHGVTLAEACEVLGKSVKQYENSKTIGRNRRLIAAAALVAMDRQQYVRWPTDVIKGLQGERAKSFDLARQSQDEAA